MARSSSGDSVLERFVRICEAFDPETERMPVGTIARRADLPLSTASRLVEQMIQLGLLHRGDDRQIGIGMRMWELAARAAPTRGLREAALPFLEDVHAVIGQHVQLGVLDGREVLFVERLSAPESVINITQIAGRLPLHASSSGLVLLAHTPRDLQQSILAGRLQAYTPETIVRPEKLRAVLADIRRTGQVVCPGYIHEDATGVAVPVRNHRDQVVAAISVVVPNDAHARSTVPLLQAAARAIQRTLRVGTDNPDPATR